MYEFKGNKKRNVVLCVPMGRFDVTEAKAYNEQYARCVDQVDPGFTLLVDLRNFTPTDEEVRLILKEGTEYAITHGLSRVIRIVNGSVGSTVGNIQWNRAAREMGYQVDVVESMEEAEQLAGWH